ncbi:unnamed protein product [Closterium sp. Naga37s-1]|nr:unnamed protein product [Closterium sp. Naga37s-1]
MGTEAALKTFTAEELDEATNNYARENSLGRGGFGTGYRGKLADGSPVLVMKLNPDNTRQAAEKFTREVTILTRADHPHLVKLLGYNPEARCIVYESLPGGSLEDRLLTEGGRKTMKQKHRLRIAAEASEALLFLHHLEPPILHQDVKPGNVMLNEDLSCKVGGVGLAKFLPANDSSIWGTVGYIDPLLLRTGKYGPQSDLYGLGLVILQLLTGEKVNKVLEFAKFGLDGILDHLDKTVQWNPEIVKEVADVALKCRDRMSRPDLETVVLPMLKKYAEQTKGEKEAEAAPPAAAGAAGGGGASKGHDKKGAAAAAAAAPQKKGLFGCEGRRGKGVGNGRSGMEEGKKEGLGGGEGRRGRKEGKGGGEGRRGRKKGKGGGEGRRGRKKGKGGGEGRRKEEGKGRRGREEEGRRGREEGKGGGEGEMGRDEGKGKVKEEVKGGSEGKR